MKLKDQKFTIGLIMVAIITLFLSGETFAQKSKKKNNSSTKTKQTTQKSSRAEIALKAGITRFDEGTLTSLQLAVENFSEAASLFEAQNDSIMVAETLGQLGRAYKKLNNLDLAFQNYKKAIGIFEQKGDSLGRAYALNNIGAIARDQGKFNDALQYYQAALTLFQTGDVKKGEAQTLNGIGECYFALGNGQLSLQHFRQANEIWKEYGANIDKVRNTFNMGRISFAYNEIQPGLNYLNQALSESRHYDDPILEGDILDVLADYYLINGELNKAIQFRKTVFDSFTNPKAWAVSITRKLNSVNNLVVTYYRAGDFQSAFNYLEQGIKIGKQNNEMIATAILLGNKGVLLVDQGNYDDGIELLNQGITVSRQTNNKITEAYFLASLGYAYSETGEQQQGLNYLNQAMQIAEIKADPDVEGKVISTLIKIYAEIEDKKKVDELSSYASSRKLDVGINTGTLQVLEAAGYAQHLFGNSQDALRLLNQSFAIAQKLNHEVEKAKILYIASLAYEETKDYQKAISAAQQSHDFWKKIGNQSLDFLTHFQMGQIYTGMDNNQAAIDQFNTVLGFPVDLGMKDSRAWSNLFLGLLYLNNQNFQKSLESYNQAYNLFENLGDKNNQKTSLNGIADVYEKMGDKKQAKEYRNRVKKIK